MKRFLKKVRWNLENFFDCDLKFIFQEVIMIIVFFLIMIFLLTREGTIPNCEDLDVGDSPCYYNDANLQVTK
jgi:hypothetical protein